MTGGASGIGASIVEAFASQGADVGFLDTDRARGEALADSLGVWFRAQDVTDVGGLKKAVQDFAQAELDVLVNNVANDERQAFGDVTPDDWRANLAINLDPVAFATQAALPALKASGHASVVNLGSINAILGPAELPAYSAAKAAILGLTRSLARAYGGDRIRVNSVMPGWVETERQMQLHLTPEKRAAWLELCALKGSIMPEHIADTVLFLASDASERITGQSFIVDGGRV
ncbi:MAG: SDR family NAD(P)-dependent oxidoreductase [Pseudomonadota bacterium]